MLSSLLKIISIHQKYRHVENEDDYEFIIDRCIAESQEGHFSEIYALPILEIQKGLRHQIACAINDLPYPFEAGNPRHETGAKIFIIEINKKRAGFLLLLEHMPDSWNEKIEIHLLSILPEYRGKAVGEKIILDLMKFTPAREIYARCYVKSGAMNQILKNIGFKVTETSNNGTQTLSLYRDK